MYIYVHESLYKSLWLRICIIREPRNFSEKEVGKEAISIRYNGAFEHLGMAASRLENAPWNVGI